MEKLTEKYLVRILQFEGKGKYNEKFIEMDTWYLCSYQDAIDTHILKDVILDIIEVK